MPVEFKDLENLDPELSSNLAWLMENDISELNLTFSYNTNYLDLLKTIDLIPNGRNIAVTNENKIEYILLYTYYKLIHEIKSQLKQLLKGIYEIIPKEKLSLLTVEDLSKILGGNSQIDIKEIKNYSSYRGFWLDDQVITWFWEILEELDEEKKSKFLFFVSGSYKSSIYGFKNFVLCINKVYRKNILPVAHTCSLEIDLPDYDSKEIFKEKLILAITEGTYGFHVT